MPLAPNIMTFAVELATAYSDVRAEKSAAVFAKKRATAVYNFMITAVPMTLTIFPAPGMSIGTGGFDKPIPGMGLDAAKPILVKDIIDAWYPVSLDPIAVGLREGQAIMKFMLEAIVLVTDIAAIDPISLSGASAGTGGIGKPVPGKGLAAARIDLEQALLAIWIKNKSVIGTPQFAQEYAEAIDNFVKEGMVTTVGVVSGGQGMSVTATLS